MTLIAASSCLQRSSCLYSYSKPRRGEYGGDPAGRVRSILLGVIADMAWCGLDCGLEIDIMPLL
jgi:hypothetical protein